VKESVDEVAAPQAEHRPADEPDLPPSARWELPTLHGAAVRRHPKTWRLAAESHPFYEVCYVRAGLGTVTVDGQAHTASRGTLFLMAPGVTHSGHANPYGMVEMAHVHVTWPPALLSRYGECVPRQAVLRLEPQVEAELHAVLERIIAESRGAWPAWPLALSAALLDLFAFVVRTGHRLRGEETGEASGDEPVRRASEYVHAHLGDRLSVAGVARAIGYHPGYLSRVFRRETGVRLVEYILRARVEYAARLLVAGHEQDGTGGAGQGGPVRVQTVASRAGFASAHYFSRVFRQLKGCSPSAFRRGVAARGGRHAATSPGDL
jgi:AraC-like DNA-binding protein/mannose-6-phosphate isomerase-like protein (cupin superfamily)